MEGFLSQTAEYALRAVAGFATRAAGERVRARDLSRETDVPQDYLAKILRRLVVAGVLHSHRGQGGGFSLAKPAERITFREVLEAVDSLPASGQCAFGWGACNASQPCALHDPWSRMSEVFERWSAETTFADLTPRLRRRRRRTGAAARPKRR